MLVLTKPDHIILKKRNIFPGKASPNGRRWDKYYIPFELELFISVTTVLKELMRASKRV
jgi:hypothetical protein